MTNYWRSPYQADGSALVYAGEPAILELQLRAPDVNGVFHDEVIGGRLFVQRVIDGRGAVLVQVAGEPISAASENFVRFTLRADQIDALLAGRAAVDLRHLVFEALEDGSRDLFLPPAPFSVRLLDSQTAPLPGDAPAQVSGPAARFTLARTAQSPRLVITQRGGRGEAGTAAAATVAFDDTAAGLGVTTVQAAIDLIVHAVRTGGTLDFSDPANSGLFTIL